MADLNVVGQNWRQMVDPWSDGDFNADGIVDSADLNAFELAENRPASRCCSQRSRPRTDCARTCRRRWAVGLDHPPPTLGQPSRAAYRPHYLWLGSLCHRQTP